MRRCRNWQSTCEANSHRSLVQPPGGISRRLRDARTWSLPRSFSHEAQAVAAPARAPTVANLAAAIREIFGRLGMDRLQAIEVAHGSGSRSDRGTAKDVRRTRPERHLTVRVQQVGAGHPRRGGPVGPDGAVRATSTCSMSDFVAASKPGCRFSYLIYRRVGPYQISSSGWISPWHINRARVGRAREIATSSPSDQRRKLAEYCGNVLELLGCSLRSTARRSSAKPSGCPSMRLPRRFQTRRSPPCRSVSPLRRTSGDPEKNEAPHPQVSLAAAKGEGLRSVLHEGVYMHAPRGRHRPAGFFCARRRSSSPPTASSRRLPDR